MRLPTRPVVPGTHPDPSVCRADGSYWLACSSFGYAPGVPLFRSDDLVAWEQVGHVLDRPSQLRLDGAGTSGGVYAPTLRHHAGRCWLVTTDVSGGPGQLLVTAGHPAGPWSDPVTIPDAPGIDPDLAWDDDGTCYLTWCAYGPGGHEGIVQAVLDPATGRLLTPPARLWQGTGGQVPEAPHLYRVGAWWYLLLAEGGTERGHAAVVARSASPSGPFEADPGNPFLTARGTGSPVQSTGHADLVARPDASWAVLWLGTRPRGSTPGWHVLGRETFASEVVWEDGWPRLGAPLEPAAVPAVTEDLAGPVLPPSWVALGRHPAEVLHHDGGAWVLRGPARDDPGAGPVFAGRRQDRTTVRARAVLDAGDGAGGLELRVDPAHAVRLEVDGGLVRAVALVGTLRAVLGEATAVPGTVLELRTAPARHDQSAGPRGGPDEVVASVLGPDGPGSPVELGRLDGRYLSTEVAGGFTGRMVGVVALRGDVVVRAFSYSGDAET
ncbi:glycoside hydrolase family 43 protein [Aquipuribacter hungaricus]|uniref:Glycoside hydrolase family 43 protein n=1 Tax=Aquipuribacter hungaricus TaxID=545624 RepID=A0ABV7WF46_9MICO